MLKSTPWTTIYSLSPIFSAASANRGVSKQLVEDFARYPYLQRLRDPEVLVTGVRDGIASTTWRTETFAFAEGYDEKAGRYLGLKTGKVVAVSADAPGLVVKAERAEQQQMQEAASQAPASGPTPSRPPGESVQPPLPGAGPASTQPQAPVAAEKPDHFFGNVQVDPTRISRDVGAIANEVIQHLASLVGAEVKVTVEIQARVPAGVPESVVRTVSENCRTLKFTSHGFEREQ